MKDNDFTFYILLCILREFLKTNAHYSKKEAIDTLVDNGFYEIALTMAKVGVLVFF